MRVGATGGRIYLSISLSDSSLPSNTWAQVTGRDSNLDFSDTSMRGPGCRPVRVCKDAFPQMTVGLMGVAWTNEWPSASFWESHISHGCCIGAAQSVCARGGRCTSAGAQQTGSRWAHFPADVIYSLK